MKRLFFILSLVSMMFVSVPQYAQAGFIADYKAKLAASRQYAHEIKQIQEVFNLQDKFANSYDFENLYKLYSDEFYNSDGYDKKVYFKLVKETWETYPEISYSTKIKSISVNSSYAIVETIENAFAVTEEDNEYISAIGELHSQANCRYYLRKEKGHWLISSEDILDERSTLKYGNARFVKMELNAPTLVPAGHGYSAELKVDLPEDAIVIASINQEKIVQPVEKIPEKYRKLPSDQILERLFVANTNNVNEYSIAAVGLTETEPVDDENVKIYMNGLAFLMTRVNVIPKNNFVKLDISKSVKELKGGEAK